MPEAAFGQQINVPSTGGSYIKLKGKGDKVKFIIAGTPHYETQHWIDGHPVLCDRYNGSDKNAPCQYCDQYQAALEEAGDDKDAQKLANKKGPVTTFYYPILNLADDKPAIFQFTAQSIHWNISSYADEGMNVMEQTWLVTRTETPGSYYDVKNLGIQRLTAEQEEALERASKLKIKLGKESSSVNSSNYESEGEEVEDVSDEVPI